LEETEKIATIEIIEDDPIAASKKIDEAISDICRALHLFDISGTLVANIQLGAMLLDHCELSDFVKYEMAMTSGAYQPIIYKSEKMGIDIAIDFHRIYSDTTLVFNKEIILIIKSEIPLI